MSPEKGARQKALEDLAGPPTHPSPYYTVGEQKKLQTSRMGTPGFSGSGASFK